MKTAVRQIDRIYEMIVASGGATHGELAEFLHINIGSVCGCVARLRHIGLVCDSLATRKTRLNQDAKVWAPVANARKTV